MPQCLGASWTIGHLEDSTSAFVCNRPHVRWTSFLGDETSQQTVAPPVEEACARTEQRPHLIAQGPHKSVMANVKEVESGLLVSNICRSAKYVADGWVCQFYFARLQVSSQNSMLYYTIPSTIALLSNSPTC
eukprot:3694690-Amphidinium_carterae.1